MLPEHGVQRVLWCIWTSHDDDATCSQRKKDGKAYIANVLSLIWAEGGKVTSSTAAQQRVLIWTSQADGIRHKITVTLHVHA
jgi:hypothetical protein